MKFFILSLSIITITASVVPPSPQVASQYDARAVGAMPCYLGCCKLFDREGFLFALFVPSSRSYHIDRLIFFFFFMNIDLHVWCISSRDAVRTNQLFKWWLLYSTFHSNISCILSLSYSIYGLSVRTSR